MTAAVERVIMHPSWCNPANCSGGHTPEHRSTYTTWRTVDGYAQIDLALNRADDRLPEEGQLRGEVKIRLGICDVEAEDTFADAYLGREDARLLMTFLQRHFDEMGEMQRDYPRNAKDE